VVATTAPLEDCTLLATELALLKLDATELELTELTKLLELAELTDATELELAKDVATLLALELELPFAFKELSHWDTVRLILPAPAGSAPLTNTLRRAVGACKALALGGAALKLKYLAGACTGPRVLLAKLLSPFHTAQRLPNALKVDCCEAIGISEANNSCWVLAATTEPVKVGSFTSVWLLRKGVNTPA
jgi:hypothetical protein